MGTTNGPYPKYNVMFDGKMYKTSAAAERELGLRGFATMINFFIRGRKISYTPNNTLKHVYDLAHKVKIFRAKTGEEINFELPIERKPKEKLPKKIGGDCGYRIYYEGNEYKGFAQLESASKVPEIRYYFRRLIQGNTSFYSSKDLKRIFEIISKTEVYDRTTGDQIKVTIPKIEVYSLGGE